MNHNGSTPQKDLPSYSAARDAVKALLESDAVYFGREKIEAVVDSVIGALSEGTEPVATLEWSNGDPSHVLLPAAFSLPDGQYGLYPLAVPSTVPPTVDDLIDPIAKEWDGCTYEGVGNDIDIGQAIRASAKKIGFNIVSASADLAAFKAYDLSAARALVENTDVKVFMRTDEPTAPSGTGDADE
ncbi:MULTISPECIES: hypothetical protein [Achromobacter]|uniref:hypothetical protein n=1 Tax=Achromobacter TaxID=222 RepID=UPI0023F87D6E|nr:hypothetical protein [Achromobacter anxifer]MDF8363355.1 hypothetical protein [Achromobacter anxifer]